MRKVDEMRDHVRELEQKVEDLEGMLGELPPEGKCAMLLVQNVGGEYVWACEPYDFASYVVVDAEADAYTGKVFSDPFKRALFSDRLTVAELLRRAAAELDETGDAAGVMDGQARLIEELEAERDEWKAMAERTCRNVAKDDSTDEFVCSECGHVDGAYEYGSEVGECCKGCGARVVDAMTDAYERAKADDAQWEREHDSREKLERDARVIADNWSTYGSKSTFDASDIIALLDRQAAITRRETRQNWQDAPNVLDRTNLQTIAELQSKVDELQAQLEAHDQTHMERSVEMDKTAAQEYNLDVQVVAEPKIEYTVELRRRRGATTSMSAVFHLE